MQVLAAHCQCSNDSRPQSAAASVQPLNEVLQLISSAEAATPPDVAAIVQFLDGAQYAHVVPHRLAALGALQCLCSAHSDSQEAQAELRAAAVSRGALHVLSRLPPSANSHTHSSVAEHAALPLSHVAHADTATAFLEQPHLVPGISALSSAECCSSSPHSHLAMIYAADHHRLEHSV